MYLLATGHVVGELVKMSSAELRRLDLPPDFAVYRDEVLQEKAAKSAFAYPSGKAIPHTSYYRLISTTAKKVLGRPLSQEMFRHYISTGKIKE